MFHFMKVVLASTPTQEERIDELIQTFYSKVFPFYFSDEEIIQFERLKVLAITPEKAQLLSTLKTSYQVIASLQTLVNILEDPENKHKYKHLFAKNVQILEELDIFFPFHLENFKLSSNGDSYTQVNFSMYAEANNSYLL